MAPSSTVSVMRPSKPLRADRGGAVARTCGRRRIGRRLWMIRGSEQVGSVGRKLRYSPSVPTMGRLTSVYGVHPRTQSPGDSRALPFSAVFLTNRQDNA